MSRRLPKFLLLAAGAAVVQASATLGAVAWLSRTLTLEDLGRFGLYLGIVSFSLALDGVRQLIVVRGASDSPGDRSLVEDLAGLSIVYGAVIAIVVALAGALAFGLSWQEWLPIGCSSGLLIGGSPGFARMETSGRAHHAVLLHATSWSVSLLLGALLASSLGDVTCAAWALLAAPTINQIGLWRANAIVSPKLSRATMTSSDAFHGIGSHLITASGGFLDRAVLASSGTAVALGLYTPIAELVGRASALSGMGCNLFLNDEVRSAHADASARTAAIDHRTLLDRAFMAAGAGIVASAAAAPVLLEWFLGRTTPTQVLALQLLLSGLALNVGAQWSAVALRARGRFDLYRPYAVTLALGIAAAPALVTTHGAVGAAITVLILRTADIWLIYRARAAIGTVKIAAIVLTVVPVLLIAVFGAS